MLTGDAAHALAAEVRERITDVHAAGTEESSCSTAASPAAHHAGAGEHGRPTCWRSSISRCATTGTRCRLPSGRALRAPGPFVRRSRTPIALGPTGARRRRAHSRGARRAAGSHRPRSAAPCRASPRSESRPRALPLEGVKVADFSWIGVGPITAKSLADHGATVVHVETEQPGRSAAPRRPVQGRHRRHQPLPVLRLVQHLEAVAAAQPEAPAGHRRRQAPPRLGGHRLDSFTAGTMAALGLGYDVAPRLNPSIIMASTCLMGQTGPAPRSPATATTPPRSAASTRSPAGTTAPPAGPFNAYTDTIAPRFLAATLMAALDHRRRTGEGQYIDQAQMESSLHFLAPELLDVRSAGARPRRAGNDSPDGRAARRLSLRRRGRVVRDRGRDRRAVARAAQRAGRARLGGGSRRSPRAAGRLAPRERIDGELAASPRATSRAS